MHRVTWITAAYLALSAANAAPVLNPANGHFYEVIRPASGINWDNAAAAAGSSVFMGATGYLATITSSDENAFILSLFAGEVTPGQTWLGGFQPAGSPEPGGGWQWVTAELFLFTNWGPNEPNNAGNAEDAVGLYTGPNAFPGTWNDFGRLGTAHFSPFTYVVEYEPAAIPEPSTLLMTVAGVVFLKLKHRATSRPTE